MDLAPNIFLQDTPSESFVVRRRGSRAIQCFKFISFQNDFHRFILHNKYSEIKEKEDCTVDKGTIVKWGGVLSAVIITLAVLIAMARPFGNYIVSGIAALLEKLLSHTNEGWSVVTSGFSLLDVFRLIN